MITLITGPPCAGKSTLARERAAPTDTVVDFDDIALALGSPRRWMHSSQVITVANHLMQARLYELASEPDVTAWVIQAAPRAARRERLAAALKARVWVLDPGIEVCLQRAAARPYGTAAEIRKWYRLYTPSLLDEKVAA